MQQPPRAAGPNHPAPSREISVVDLLSPLMRDWRLVLACIGAFWLLTALVTFVPARKYRASMVVAAVPSARGMALPSGVSALLTGGQMGGVQSTPYFIAKLLYLNSVLYKVAFSSSTARPGASVVERAMDTPLRDIRYADVARQMKKMLETDIDKQTGLLTVGVVHEDSALAREIASRTMASASEAFVQAARAQATEQRRAQEGRVDSAAKRLRSREEQMLTFVSSNRTFTPYSTAWVERQRLERELDNAQAVYSQAIADRERAIAQELEETPAVVVVDPIPAELTPLPRQTVLKFFVGTLLGFFIAAVVVWLRVWLAGRARSEADLPPWDGGVRGSGDTALASPDRERRSDPSLR
jgi:uncharacterized protein involved in exopolysaccharide biosynthesis